MSSTVAVIGVPVDNGGKLDGDGAFAVVDTADEETANKCDKPATPVVTGTRRHRVVVV